MEIYRRAIQHAQPRGNSAVVEPLVTVTINKQARVRSSPVPVPPAPEPLATESSS
jgi:hypothetical protein